MKSQTKPKPFGQLNVLSLAALVITGAVFFPLNASAAPCASVAWKQGESYQVGKIVRYKGNNYQVLHAHAAIAGTVWTPERYPTMWKDLGKCNLVSTPVAASAAPEPTKQQINSNSGSKSGGDSASGGSSGSLSTNGGGSFSGGVPQVSRARDPSRNGSQEQQQQALAQENVQQPKREQLKQQQQQTQRQQQAKQAQEQQLKQAEQQKNPQDQQLQQSKQQQKLQEQQTQTRLKQLEQQLQQSKQEQSRLQQQLAQLDTQKNNPTQQQEQRQLKEQLQKVQQQQQKLTAELDRLKKRPSNSTVLRPRALSTPPTEQLGQSTQKSTQSSQTKQDPLEKQLQDTERAEKQYKEILAKLEKQDQQTKQTPEHQRQVRDAKQFLELMQKKKQELMAQLSPAIGPIDGEWRNSNLTYYQSYPPPGSEECVAYNGCTWAGQFTALGQKMPESWVKENNIIAIHEKDFPKYKLKTFRITQGNRVIDAKVYDMCSDSDCGGCCTSNLRDGFLIDMEKHTAARFGSTSGTVKWICIDCN